MKIKNYKELKIWQKGIEIVDQIYDLTNLFPSKEQYGLTSQMNRAAVSIPSNIAEGFVRIYKKEYCRFLYISLGSCAELDTQLIIARNRSYLNTIQYGDLNTNIIHEMKMINSLLKVINTQSASC